MQAVLLPARALLLPPHAAAAQPALLCKLAVSYPLVAHSAMRRMRRARRRCRSHRQLCMLTFCLACLHIVGRLLRHLALVGGCWRQDMAMERLSHDKQGHGAQAQGATSKRRTPALPHNCPHPRFLLCHPLAIARLHYYSIRRSFAERLLTRLGGVLAPRTRACACLQAARRPQRHGLPTAWAAMQVVCVCECVCV